MMTYTVEIRGPLPEKAHELFALKARVFSPAIDEMEENLEDLLPPEFSVRIKEWDA